MNKYRNTNAANTTKTYNKHEIEDPTNNIYEAISIISKSCFAILILSDKSSMKIVSG